MKMTIPNPIQYSTWIDLVLCDLRKDARFHPDEEVDNLAKSIEIKQLQPVILCRNGDRYEALAGVGRILAARKLGWAKIRADVYEGLNELQKLEMIFSENEDRKNASPLYQAQVIKGMMEAGNFTQETLAEQLGKTQQNISQYAVLLELSPKIWENTNAFVKFGLRHFNQLLRIEDKDDQWKLAETSLQKAWSSSELKAVVDKRFGVKAGNKGGRPKGDKNLGVEGFAFVQKGSNLRIKANCNLSQDIDAFLAQLKAAILTWRESHTKTPAGIAGKGKPS